MEQPTEAPSRRAFLRTALGVTAGLTGSALAACSPRRAPRPDDSGAPSPATVAPSHTSDVTAFGAVGDGRADDTDAIERALRSLSPGHALHFAGGKVFCHSRVLTVSTPDVQLLGSGRLLATQEATSALKIDAAGVLVDGLSLGVSSTTQRWGTPDQHKLYIGSHPGVVIRNVSIDGSAAAGLFCFGAAQFSLERVTVSDTRADGIHMTNGCTNGRVESPVIKRTGDDGVAVVSYANDATSCRNISVNNARVFGTTGGRGMSVVGGTDVTYKNIGISDSYAAGLYIACESGDFVSRPTSNVVVSDGHITGANTATQIDHGAVLVYSGRGGEAVSSVRVSNLTITRTRPSASRQIGVVADGPTDGVVGVVFDDLRLEARPTPYEGNAPLSGMTLSGVTAAGKTVRPSVTS